MLPAPGFHHLHPNSVDPDVAIEFDVRQYPSFVKASGNGLLCHRASGAGGG